LRSCRRLAVLLAVVLVLSACSDDVKPSAEISGEPSTVSEAAANSAGAASASCARPHAPGQTHESFDFQGMPRTYQLYVPQGYDGTRPVPVVFEFHGYGSSAAQQLSYGDFRPLADRDGFLIVAPDGQDRGGRHYNLGLETGLLACLSADRFAAFVPVAVVLYPMVCTNTRQVAFEGFSGTADPIVPFEGGAVRCCGNAVLPAPSDAMSNWAAHNGCDPNFTEERLGTEVRRRTWNDCQDGSAAVFYIIDGGGHTWPGSATATARLGLTTTQIDASETIWDFFTQHPLPAAPR